MHLIEERVTKKIMNAGGSWPVSKAELADTYTKIFKRFWIPNI